MSRSDYDLSPTDAAKTAAAALGRDPAEPGTARLAADLTATVEHVEPPPLPPLPIAVVISNKPGDPCWCANAAHDQRELARELRTCTDIGYRAVVLRPVAANAKTSLDDLIYAAELVVPWLHSEFDGCDPDHGGNVVLRKLKAAIAAAKGGAS